MILKNAVILEFCPPSIIEKIDIIINNSEIIDIGKNISDKYKNHEIIDCNGRYVFPGLVCSHNHFYSGLARGIMAKIKPSTDFVSQLKNLWWRLDRAIDPQILKYSSLISAIEAIKAGTTTVIDHHASPSFITGSLKVIKESFENTGLRGILCYEVTDRNGEEKAKEGINENIQFLENDCNNLIRGIIGAHAPFTLSNKTLSLLQQGVNEKNSGLHIHAAEDKFDTSFSHAQYNKNVIERLSDYNLINSKTIIGHGIYLEDKDIDILNNKDAFLIHNSRSNMNNGVGYNNSLSKFKHVALGTDGIGSDMFEETKFAYFKHRDSRGVLSVNDYLKFLFNGNKIIKSIFNANFGSIKKGHKADLVISDYTPPTPLKSENIAGHFIFGMCRDDIRTVIINGKIVMKDFKLPLDCESIYREARTASKRLWENMDKLD